MLVHRLIAKSTRAAGRLTSRSRQLAARQNHCPRERGAITPSGEGTPLPGTPYAAQVSKMLARMWKLPVMNKRKEALWRLVFDALPSAQRIRSQPKPCICGEVQPGRRHYFWECPVAQALIADIRDRAGTAELRCEHLWMAIPPVGACIYQGVWDVVCIMAIAAINTVKRRAYKIMKQHSTFSAPEGVEATLTTSARLLFWEYLSDFAAVIDTVPPRWQPHVSAQHPFLACSSTGTLIVHAAPEIAGPSAP